MFVWCGVRIVFTDTQDIAAREDKWISSVRTEKGDTMTNALILSMLFMLMYYNGVEHKVLFMILWWLATAFNVCGSEKWR